MSRKSKSKSHPGKVLHLFAEIQEHIHNGVIHHELSQIARHTRDKEILDTCNRAAGCLDIDIDTAFHQASTQQHFLSLKTLVNHMKKPKEIFDRIAEMIPESDPKWTEALFKTTEYQLITLSNYLTLLDKIPDVTDNNGETIKVGTLVAVNCKDEKGRAYEHYGVVIPSQQGFRVAHFFTGATVKAQNSLVEKGFGYVHEVNYSVDWIVKEYLPDRISFNQVEQRIQESRSQGTRVWNKLRYNCQHWATHMFDNNPRCPDLDKIKDERKKEKEKTGVYRFKGSELETQN
ncbi:MAG: hypothetical protein WBA41_19160 [Rivularia sp. (in: cyanobacteria)]